MPIITVHVILIVSLNASVCSPAGVFNVVLIDVDSKDMSSGMSSPPLSFLSKDFLTCLQILTAGGKHHLLIHIFVFITHELMHSLILFPILQSTYLLGYLPTHYHTHLFIQWFAGFHWAVYIQCIIRPFSPFLLPLPLLSLLHPLGIMITNLCARNKELRSTAISSLLCVFQALLIIAVPHDINEVVVCLTQWQEDILGSNLSIKIPTHHHASTSEGLPSGYKVASQKLSNLSAIKKRVNLLSAQLSNTSSAKLEVLRKELCGTFNDTMLTYITDQH